MEQILQTRGHFAAVVAVLLLGWGSAFAQSQTITGVVSDSLGGPLPGLRVCPTGGVTPENATDYLSLSNVVCVGGSWVAPTSMMRAGDWDGIEALARQAASLGG